MTTWSKDPPAEPGWYWWRMRDGTEAFVLQWLPAPKLIGYPDPEAPSFIRYRGWGTIGEWWPVQISMPVPGT